MQCKNQVFQKEASILSKSHFVQIAFAESMKFIN